MWAEAILYATFILRRLPSQANKDFKAPLQLIRNDRKPINVKNIRTFFSVVYYIEDQPKSQRFKTHGHRGHFIGYLGNNQKALRIYTEDKRTIHKPNTLVYFLEDEDKEQEK